MDKILEALGERNKNSLTIKKIYREIIEYSKTYYNELNIPQYKEKFKFI